MFIVRKSNHINEDIIRNWSSFNFGLEGITATSEQMEVWKNDTIENNESPLYISGFELWADELKSSTILELYTNYWVLVDLNRGWGLSCNILNSENLNDAIIEISNEDFTIELGEGDTICCQNAKVVYSNNDIHILEIN